jgi:phytoene dehydrogenase-like protein
MVGMNYQKKVVIAGGGMGGAILGALLGNNGIKPIIFEKEASLDMASSGPWRTAGPAGGYWLDWCASYAMNIPVREIIGKAAGVEIIYSAGPKSSIDSISAWVKGGKFTSYKKLVPIYEKPDKEAFKWVFPYLTDQDIDEIGQIFRQVPEDEKRYGSRSAYYTSEKGEAINPISIGEWMDEKGASKNVRRFFATLPCFHGNLPEDGMGFSAVHEFHLWHGLATGEMKPGLFVPQHERYHGFAAESRPFYDALREYGGKLELNTPVKEIVIENGRVRGVLVERRKSSIKIEDGCIIDTSSSEEEFVQADIVVCNISPIQALNEEIIKRDKLPPAILEIVKTLEALDSRYNYAYIQANIGLRKPVVPLQYTGWNIFIDQEGNAPGPGFCPISNHMPRTAPWGKQSLNILTNLKRDKFGEKWPGGKTIDYILHELFLPLLRENFGEEFDRNVEMIYITSLPHTWPVTMLHPEAPNVPIISGVENLYFCGVFTDAQFYASVKVFDSALRCAELILGKELVDKREYYP